MEHAPIFVTGFKRSGTTLLGNLIDRHPRIAVFVESFFIPRYYYTQFAYWPLSNRANLRRLARAITREGPARRNGMVYNGSVVETLTERTYPALLNALMSAWAAQQGKMRWGDKSPGYVNKMAVLNRMYPDARFVHIIRDGRNVWASLKKLNWESNVALVANEWQRTIKRAQQFARERLDGRYFEVSYEALVADPETHLRATMAFLGETYSEDLLNPTAAEARNAAFAHWPKINSPIDKGSGSSWMNELTEHELAMFESVAAGALLRTGYGVEPRRRSVQLYAQAQARVLSGKAKRSYDLLSRRGVMVVRAARDRLGVG